MWVFGYGSLLWNPGFEYVQCQLATLSGYHRSFCMRSIHHRGTPEAPGLVLALDEQPDALCHGMDTWLLGGWGYFPEQMGISGQPCRRNTW